MTFKYVILKNSLSNHLANNYSGILDIIKQTLRTRIGRHADRSFCHVILTFPSTVSSKLLCTELWTPKLFHSPSSITTSQHLLRLLVSRATPARHLFFNTRQLIFKLIYPLSKCPVGRGDTGGKQHCTVLQNLPCSGAGNLGHCLEPSSSHGNAETSGSGQLAFSSDKAQHVSMHAISFISYADFTFKGYVRSGLYL